MCYNAFGDYMTFTITPSAKAHLRSLDQHMKALIDHVEHPVEQQLSDGFYALCDIIIGQQISETAKAAIMARFKDAFDPVDKATLKSADIEALRSVGLSRMKARTIVRLAQSDVDFDALKAYPLQTIQSTLLAFKGVGQWSVDMFFFVAMGHPDVFSLKDIGIINGLVRLYGIDKEAAQNYKHYFSPYSSTAMAYLWKLLEIDDATLKTIKKDVEQ